MTLISSTAYRIQTHHADRRNGRGSMGKTMVRRVNSKRTKVVTRLLEEADSNLIADMGNGIASDSIIRNVIFVRTGQNIAIQKLSHLKKAAHALPSNLDNSTSVTRPLLSCTKKMIDHCKVNSYDYIVLLHNLAISPSAITSNYVCRSKTSTTDHPF